MKQMSMKIVAVLIAVLIAVPCIVFTTPVEAANLLPIGPSEPASAAPTTSINGSTLYWSMPQTAKTPSYFTIQVDGALIYQQLGPYANSFDLTQLALSAGTHQIVVIANYTDPVGAYPSNMVVYQTTNVLTPPTISLAAGNVLQISVNWPTVPSLIIGNAYFLIYVDNLAPTRISMTRMQLTTFDLSTLNLTQGQHSVYVVGGVDGGTYAESAASNAVYFQVFANPLPQPTITELDNGIISIAYDTYGVPTYIANAIEYRLYINGQAVQQLITTKEFDLHDYVTRESSYRIKVVLVSPDNDWQDSNASNELRVGLVNHAAFTDATVTPTAANTGNYVTVTVTGIEYAEKLEFVVRVGQTLSPVITVNNPGRTVTQRIQMTNAGSNEIVVTAVAKDGGENQTKVLNVQVTALTPPGGTTPLPTSPSVLTPDMSINTALSGTTIYNPLVYQLNPVDPDYRVGYVALRVFAENFLKVLPEWNAAGGYGTIVATRADTGASVTLVVRSNDPVATVNGVNGDIASYFLQGASGPAGSIYAKNINGSIYLPLRFVANTFGWNIRTEGDNIVFY